MFGKVDVTSANVAKLPQKYKQIIDAPTYPVEISKGLAELVKELKERITRTEILNSSPKKPFNEKTKTPKRSDLANT